MAWPVRRRPRAGGHRQLRGEPRGSLCRASRVGRRPHFARPASHRGIARRLEPRRDAARATRASARSAPLRCRAAGTPSGPNIYELCGRGAGHAGARPHRESAFRACGTHVVVSYRGPRAVQGVLRRRGRSGRCGAARCRGIRHVPPPVRRVLDARLVSGSAALDCHEQRPRAVGRHRVARDLPQHALRAWGHAVRRELCDVRRLSRGGGVLPRARRLGCRRARGGTLAGRAAAGCVL